MEKILLIDGNSILFRGYHATSYGNILKTSQGIPTNAVLAFARMISKAITLVEPDYILIAFDAGKKNFRHEIYPEYKGTRKEVDMDLVIQFPIVREYIDSCNISRYECEGVEADDIIGTLAKKYPNHQINILSSDKDLLQLIDPTTNVWLLKQGVKEIHKVDETELMNTMGLKPEQIIDLKSLMGDSSDNIPGVKGIGEKGATKLLEEYGSLNNIYDNIDNIKGKTQEKLINDKERAFMSYELATIKTDCFIPLEIEEMTYELDIDKANNFYNKYEMASMIIKKEVIISNDIEVKLVNELDKITKESIVLFDYDVDFIDECNVYGVGVLQDNVLQYLDINDALNSEEFIEYMASNPDKITYDSKYFYHICNKLNLAVNDIKVDLMIAIFLNDTLVNNYAKYVEKYELDNKIRKEEVYGKRGKILESSKEVRVGYMKSLFNNLYVKKDMILQEIASKNMNELLYDIEMPLVKILYEMENEGIRVSKDILNSIAVKTILKINELEDKIYELAGHEFNVSSPKQLGVVLFDELALKSGKKKSTAQEVLEKLVDKHDIIPYILLHRKYSKLYSTYAIGLEKHIKEDGRIHTIYNQCLTQTGRLSSSEPNLQNISVKDDEAKEIRKSFIAKDGHIFVSADYSQIELRVLASLAQEQAMIDAFNNKIDIHTSTAVELFDVDEDNVTSIMRRNAKAVNFGIVYGMSDFGLSEQLQISRSEAKSFIQKYLNTYPGIKSYMDETISDCELNGYVTTIFNRRREIKEINDSNYMVREFGKRAAMNAPIQGSAADIIKIAMIKVHNKLKEMKLKSKMILQIHDEIIIEACDDEVTQVIDILKNEMKNAYNLDVILEVNISEAKCWYDAK